MSMPSKVCFFLLAGLSVGAACSSGPKYHVNDVVLADVPLSQKQGVLGAEAEIDRAKEEIGKAQADVAADDRDISVAQAERSQVKMEGAKVGADVRLARRGQDLNRIDAAKGEAAAVNSEQRISEAKINWLRSRRDYHQHLVEVAQLHRTAAEQRKELEKARLAQATNKRPSENFSVSQFEQQAAQAQQRYDDARARAAQEASESARLEQLYSQLAAQRTRM